MPAKPKTWTMWDMPSPAEMEEYLSRIRAAGEAFPGVEGFPALPPDMEGLTFEEANDIEMTLSRVHDTINRLETSRVYSGELQSGGF